jgi:hypothetical protein
MTYQLVTFADNVDALCRDINTTAKYKETSLIRRQVQKFIEIKPRRPNGI